MAKKSTVLITGCSDGGLGAGLALAFHQKGLRVLATARNPAKMASLKLAGIECLTLDVLSDESIKSCVSEVTALLDGSLDILLNNAGGLYTWPLATLDLNEGRKLFDLNVWSYVAVTQAFLPLILEAKGMIVNNTSAASVIPTPYGSAYNSSKAAAAMFSDQWRLELAPFGVKVVDLKTGAVVSNAFKTPLAQAKLPPGTLYEPIKKEVDMAIGGGMVIENRMPLMVWAKGVVGDLLSRSPPAQVWRGQSSLQIWLVRTFLSHTWPDGLLSKMGHLDELARKVTAQEKK